jgi:hypothetical protein
MFAGVSADKSRSAIHVGAGFMIRHFNQNAEGARHFGVVTIRMGFFRCCRIDKRRLQSVGDSGVKVISHEKERNQARDSCLVRRRIDV